MDYTITLTEAEQKAMEYIAYDVFDWIENAVKNRARIAIDEIVDLEVERITSKGGEISGTKEDIVVAAPIKSAKQRQEEIEAELKAKEQEGGAQSIQDDQVVQGAQGNQGVQMPTV